MLSIKKIFKEYTTGISSIVILFAFAHLFHHFIFAMLGPLWPAIRDEFGIDYTQFGFLIAAFGLTQGIANLPWGWLSDRIGQRILVLTGISGVAIAGVIVGLSQSYIMIAIALIVLGLVSGAYHVAAVPLITRAADEKKQGSSLGLHMIGSSVCFLSAPLVSAGIAGALGWRAPLLIISGPIFVFGIVLYLLLRRVPEIKGRRGASSEHTATSGKDGFKWWYLIPFLSLSIIGTTLAQAPHAFLSLYLVDKFNATQNVVAVYLTLISAGGLIAGPLGGFLSDRFGAPRVILVVFLACVPLVYFLNIAPYPVLLLIVFILIGMANYIRMPVTEMYLMGHTPKNYRSTVLGIYYFAGNEVISGFTPVAGYLIDVFDFAITFIILSVSILALVLITGVWLLKQR